MHQSRECGSPLLSGLLPLVIGVTGHRDLRPVDREALEAQVRAIFKDLRRRYLATPLVLLSPLAEGADRLAARVALSCSVSLIVPLPMAQDLYEADFETPASLAEFRDLLQQAESDPLACSLIDSPETGPVFHIVTPRLSYPHPNGEPLNLQKLVPNAAPERMGMGSGRSGSYAGAEVVAPDTATPYDRIYERMDIFNKDAVALTSKRIAELQASRSALLPESEAEFLTVSLQHDLDCYAKADVLARHFEHRRVRILRSMLGLLFIAVILFQIYVNTMEGQLLPDWHRGRGQVITAHRRGRRGIAAHRVRSASHVGIGRFE